MRICVMGNRTGHFKAVRVELSPASDFAFEVGMVGVNTRVQMPDLYPPTLITHRP